MNQTAIEAVLWLVAGLFLSLLIIRRTKRKPSRGQGQQGAAAGEK